MEQGQEVPVKIVPEPDNQYDSKAIMFQCKLDNKWHKIGYIVREALDDVHRALEQKKIISVKFAWAKYLVVWMGSEPGYYAGINIARNGEWSRKVCRASTH